MKNISTFSLNMKNMASRFYLMMGAVIILGFLGQFTMAAIMGYVLAISFILGIGLKKTNSEVAAQEDSPLNKTIAGEVTRKAA